MRKFLLSGAALAAFAVGPAFAADLPVRPVYKAPPPPPVTYGWTGFYFGANLGYSWGQVRNDFIVPGPPAVTLTESQRVEGIVGGFQWGYNWQFGNWVLGTEADFTFSDERGSTTYCPVLPAPCFTARHRIPWLSTARTRLGILAMPNILLYGTAGAALGEVRSDYDFTAFGVGTLSMRDTRAGWTAGGGIEGLITPNWTLRAEALYIDLGNQRTTLVNNAGTTVFTTNRRANDTIARVAANYKFGGFGGF
jgi:outer membrane immunogenic protein